MKNPNDISAPFYDIVNSPLKGEEVTNAEIDLITSLIPPKAAILDVGCGTGRHAVVLAKKGYKVTAVDSSSKMLKVLQSKTDKVKVINADILETNLGAKNFDLVILMWNTFNELALTQVRAIEILKYFKKILSDKGKILINIDNVKNLDLSNLNFETSCTVDALTYKQIWTVCELDKKTNMTVSKEEVMISNKMGQKNAQFVSYIKQRWWSVSEIQELAESRGFQVELKKVKYNDELYLCLT